MKTSETTPIAPTPDSLALLFTAMKSTVATVRSRVGRPLTLAEKVLLGHLDDPAAADLEPGSYVRLRPDRVILQDVLGQTAMLQFMQTALDRVKVPTTIHCDHLIRAETSGAVDLRRSFAENGEVYDFLRSAAARYGAGFWEPGAGIIHQVTLENYAFPGQLIIGTDSHTPNAGGLCSCAVGVGGADAVEVMAGLPWELLLPKRIAVHLTGALDGWAAPKDVILYVAGKLGVSGATNAIVEYIGPGARTLSATGKATICNMGAEIGATTSMFPADERTLRYLRATNRGDLVPVVVENRELFEPDPEVEAEPERFYDHVIRLDLSALEPHIVGPHSPDRARPISAFAAEVRDATNGFPDTISAALIGSCTNSSYEDMTRAADVASQGAAHGVRAAVPFYATPGSARVRATTQRDGQLAHLEHAGAVVLANACGPCIGQWKRPEPVSRESNAIVTSFNRNFAGRNDGNAKTLNFIASPEVVTAFALAGHLSFNPLTDSLPDGHGASFRLVPPKPAPDVPDVPFEHGDTHYVPPGATRGPEPRIDPESPRLARLEPWPAWDGDDLVELPVLIKTKGKTTTDQISPAGAWLRFRGHLERFSDNLLSGAANAYTGEVGKTTNVVTGERRAVSEVARDYRARGAKWVIVGDANYGEGSSREHAALSPRLLNGAAVIARSFARIHESNLKKQGLLALTFADPADYDRVREGDRVTLSGLAELAPRKLVECRLHHADGNVECILLRHSYSESQLDWFRAGSALNLCRAKG
jgi:aconitate hydratase